MKQAILGVLVMALGLAATSAASAGVRVVINPFGFVAVPPPVVYEPYPYYGAPPLVYGGGGYWGHDRGGHRGRDWHDGHRGRDGHGGRR